MGISSPEIQKRRIRRVALVNPSIAGAGKSSHWNCFPHLGLMSVGTNLKISMPDIEIRIIDGNITPGEKVREELRAFNPDLVGLSVLLMNAPRAMELSRFAKKELDASVFLGNDHASNFAELFVKKHPFVDGVLKGDNADISFAKLIDYMDGRSGSLENVGGLVYRLNDGRIRSNPEKRCPLREKPIPDRSLISLEPYVENYNKTYGRWHGKKIRATTANTAAGCAHGAKSRCLYCGIYDLNVRTVGVERAWREYELLTENGINFIYEVCDSLTSLGPRYVRRLVEAKPKSINPEFFIYASTRELDDEMIELLVRMNVKRVNIGIDSGDSLMLERLKKDVPEGDRTNIVAVRRLKDSGIQVFSSLVLGSIGESEETLRRTYEHVGTLAGFGNVVSFEVSALVPMPGSDSWRMMTDPEFAKQEALRFGVETNEKKLEEISGKYLGEACPNAFELARDWASAFCKVPLGVIEEFGAKIKKLAKDRGLLSGGYGIRSNAERYTPQIGETAAKEIGVPDADAVVKEAATLGAEKEELAVDLGCGEGRNSVFLAKNGFQVIAIDFSKAALEILRKKGIGSVNVVKGDVLATGLRGESAGVVLCCDLIQHFGKEDRRKLAGEISRIAKPGGILALKTLSTESAIYRKLKKTLESGTLIPGWGIDGRIPHHFFTETELRGLFKDFDVITLELEKRVDDTYHANVLHWVFLGRKRPAP